MTGKENSVKPMSLAEVKSILKKISKDREELLYEQRIALEHSEKFAKLNVKKTNELINELKNLNYIEEIHAYKIADILPQTDDDIKTIFAKERKTLSEKDIKTILDIVSKYYNE